MAWTDLEDDGREELVYASYSGRLTCQDFTSGKVLWTFEQGAMPFKIRAFDLDGDGHKEIVSVSGAGQVVVLD